MFFQACSGSMSGIISRICVRVWEQGLMGSSGGGGGGEGSGSSCSLEVGTSGNSTGIFWISSGLFTDSGWWFWAHCSSRSPVVDISLFVRRYVLLIYMMKQLKERTWNYIWDVYLSLQHHVSCHFTHFLCHMRWQGVHYLLTTMKPPAKFFISYLHDYIR